MDEYIKYNYARSQKIQQRQHGKFRPSATLDTSPSTEIALLKKYQLSPPSSLFQSSLTPSVPAVVAIIEHQAGMSLVGSRIL